MSSVELSFVWRNRVTSPIPKVDIGDRLWYIEFYLILTIHLAETLTNTNENIVYVMSICSYIDGILLNRIHRIIMSLELSFVWRNRATSPIPKVDIGDRLWYIEQYIILTIHLAETLTNTNENIVYIMSICSYIDGILVGIY